MSRPMDEEGFRYLRAAVVERACMDYLTAGPGEHKLILGWFRSPAFAFWTNLNPEAVIKRLDEMRGQGITRLSPIWEERFE